MNITTVPFTPRTEASVWRLPSVPGKSNVGAVTPAATESEAVLTMASS